MGALAGHSTGKLCVLAGAGRSAQNWPGWGYGERLFFDLQEKSFELPSGLSRAGLLLTADGEISGESNVMGEGLDTWSCWTAVRKHPFSSLAQTPSSWLRCWWNPVTCEQRRSVLWM